MQGCPLCVSIPSPCFVDIIYLSTETGTLHLRHELLLNPSIIWTERGLMGRAVDSTENAVPDTCIEWKMEEKNSNLIKGTKRMT